MATHGVRDIDRTAIHRDITTLAQLRLRDADWDECRRKLDDLVQSDEGDFFSKQLIQPKYGPPCPPRTDDIQTEKDNTRYAIDVLDVFLNGGGHTIVLFLSQTLPLTIDVGFP